MKRALVLVFAVLLGGCSLFKGRQAPAPAAPVAAVQPATPGLPEAYDTRIERVPFRLGVSSATVEKMAKQQGCRSGEGAGLVTETGPVEVYRMRCEGGKVFMARCELRQCVKM